MASGHTLRVAAVWGTTILGVRMLQRGESYAFGEGDDAASAVAPEGLDIAPVPLRAVGNGWELDPRGVVRGVLRLRGRDEDPVSLARIGAPIPIVPGDHGLLQYGLFAVFFQYTTPGAPMTTRWNVETLVVLSFLSSGIFHVGAILLLLSLLTPPPLELPSELSPEEFAAKFHVQRNEIEEPPPPAAAAASTGGGGSTGVKDPGAKDTKKQGGGRKIAGAEGKAGLNGKEDTTQLPGEVKPVTHYGGLDEVLTSDTGREIRQTLKSIDTVASALGGLNSNTVVLGSGPGTGLKGGGSGGGGTGAGVMFGSGTLDTGWGPGTGGGYGFGSGGPGGRGSGGFGNGGRGSGNGQGNGNGNGGPGEKGVGGVAATASKGGLSPEQVRRVVVAHQGALRACYEIEAQKNPGLKGGVTATWTIDPSGAVSSASIAGSTIKNPRVEGCVVRQIRTWRFPASEGTTPTTFPFSFGIGG
jgi:hypothetical protein